MAYRVITGSGVRTCPRTSPRGAYSPRTRSRAARSEIPGSWTIPPRSGVHRGGRGVAADRAEIGRNRTGVQGWTGSRKHPVRRPGHGRAGERAGRSTDKAKKDHSLDPPISPLRCCKRSPAYSGQQTWRNTAQPGVIGFAASTPGPTQKCLQGRLGPRLGASILAAKTRRTTRNAFPSNGARSSSIRASVARGSPARAQASVWRMA